MSAPGVPAYGAVPGQPMPGQPMPTPGVPAYGAMPTPGAPAYGAMPGQPYGAPGPAAYGAPAYPMAAPVAQKKSNTGLIVGIIVLVVLIIVAIFGFHVFSSNQNDPSKPVPAGQATTAEAAVRGYLQALAAGNSADALAFVDAPTSPAVVDNSLLTDAVLAAGNAINPITNINVPKSTSSTAVTATYSIGSKAVTASYFVTKSGKYYMLSQGTTLTVMPLIDDGVTVSINGVAIKSQSAELAMFPGSYVVTVDNPLLTVTNGSFIVTSPTGTPDTSSMSLDLSTDAQAKFQDAAKTQLDSCMAEKAMETSCGFGFSASDEDTGNSIDIDNSTIQWIYGSGSSDDFSGATFSYDGYSGLTASASISIDIELDVSDTSGNPYYQTDTLYEADVDFTDPSNLAVTFQHTGGF